MNLARPLLFLLPLLVLLACGGGSGPVTPVPHARTLVYTDPPATGWRLAKAPESTDQRLVLNLVGPAGAVARGAGLVLRADTTRVAFGTFPDGSAESNSLYIKDLGVFDLRLINEWEPGTPDDPVLLGGFVRGGDLNVGCFAKQTWTGPAKAVDQPVFQIALELKPDVPAGVDVPLVVLKARILPADFPSTSWTDRKLTPISVALGRLEAR